MLADGAAKETAPARRAGERPTRGGKQEGFSAALQLSAFVIFRTTSPAVVPGCSLRVCNLMLISSYFFPFHLPRCALGLSAGSALTTSSGGQDKDMASEVPMHWIQTVWSAERNAG